MDLSRFGFRAGFDPDNKWVKQDKIKLDGKEFLVSTIDLGLDHSFGGGKPLYYETMIFAIENGEETEGKQTKPLPKPPLYDIIKENGGI